MKGGDVMNEQLTPVESDVFATIDCRIAKIDKTVERR